MDNNGTAYVLRIFTPDNETIEVSSQDKEFLKHFLYRYGNEAGDFLLLKEVPLDKVHEELGMDK